MSATEQADREIDAATVASVVHDIENHGDVLLMGDDTGTSNEYESLDTIAPAQS